MKKVLDVVKMIFFLCALFVNTWECGGHVGECERGIGEKIVLYAKKFIGKPYDPDPLGAYVRERKIVYDDKVDCMYLTFRSVELAFANGDEKKAEEVALEKRFRTQGILSNGFVVNYEERFEYGEDMFLSGKWGKLLDVDPRALCRVFSRRLGVYVPYVPKGKYKLVENFIASGGIVFFVKDPSRSKRGELVGHIGILEKSNGEIYLIHAKGVKNRSGVVVRERFVDYLFRSKYIGFVITHF